MALALAILSALLVAAALRLPSLLSTALAAYVVLVGNMAFATWTLSPFRALDATALAVEQALLLLGALTAWWLRGRPGLGLRRALAPIGLIARDPISASFVAVAAVALAYELLLAVTVPPTNWDSLTYHLARVAAWKQHHGIFWIPNAPTARMNEFQPLAEQEILFVLVACGTTVLYALPQYVGELAILAAVYGASRRLGFGVRASACSAALLATFSLIALEATTAQNDLVSASFSIAAACLLLGGGSLEAVLAGVAAGLGVGAKLTTALVLPVLVWLAWSAGRRRLRLALAGSALGLAGAGIWGFVLNLAHTGSPLGHGQGRVENTVSPSLLGTIRTVAHLVDRLADVSVLPDWSIAAFAAAGVAAGIGSVLRSARTHPTGRALLMAGAVALPLLTPALVLAMTHIPAGDPPWIGHQANEDDAAFGPLGTLALIAAPIATLVAIRGRDRRQLALALALPSYLILLALYAKYNIWITRFLIVPAVLTAPLFGRLFVSRLATAALLVVASVSVALTLAHDATKPLGGRLGRPWELTQTEALAEFPAEPTGRWVAASLEAYDRLVPPRACVGAVLDPDEPSYLLWGPNLRHHVVFLSSLTALQGAYAGGLSYVVIDTGANAPVASQFTRAGWSVKPLATYWQLATSPRPSPGGACA
jgi:hypothetical protein